MDLNHGFRGGQPLFESLVLLAQPRQLPLIGRARGPAPSAWGQGVENPLLALPSPGRQMGRIQPLSPQEGAQLAVRPGRIGLGQHAQLVAHRKLPSTGSLHPLRNFRVRDHRAHYRREISRFSYPILGHHALSAFSAFVTN